MRTMHRLNGLMAKVTLALVGVAFTSAAQATPPVEFVFAPVQAADGDPYARELWAEVITPSEKVLRLPAFFAGGEKFAVRARADETGEYRFGKVTEATAGTPASIEVRVNDGATREVTTATPRPAVRIAKESPRQFTLANGEPYVPLGANLAWATEGDRVAWYQRAFREFSKAGLNWSRVWMAHWGGLNLDWLPEDLPGASTPGRPDERIAQNWDGVLAEAEAAGVYVQMVLQHHGQFTTQVNPNWADNPWNAANGGVLATPAEFFTSPAAARLTRQKYRYIVARWGYSPAVLAWELFNEVHWVDAVRIEKQTAEVARWHDEMAAFLRSLDVYKHLVTTSTDDLHSPIYASMDYLQPHLYAVNMLAGLRRFDVAPGEIDRPIFYGEMGHDHMRLSAAQKEAGLELAPLAWAGVMGDGRLPAQLWEGEKMLRTGRVGELAALSRFLADTRLAGREGLMAFSAAIEDAPVAALTIEAGENWHRRPPVTLTVAADGRASLDEALVPRILVGSPKSVADGYPDRVTFRVDAPTAATARLRLADAGRTGATLRVRVGSATAGEHAWGSMPASDAAVGPRSAEISFELPAGPQVIVVENTGGEDWVEFGSLELGVDVPVLGTFGRRSDDFVVVWVWHRTGLTAIEPGGAVTGTVVIENVPAGAWTATWWDGEAGERAAASDVQHPGGGLRVPTPGIRRHAALVLERRGD